MAASIVLLTGLGGWMSGYLNERAGNGSILPSWLMHGATNAITYGALAFTG